MICGIYFCPVCKRFGDFAPGNYCAKGHEIRWLFAEPNKSNVPLPQRETLPLESFRPGGPGYMPEAIYKGEKVTIEMLKRMVGLADTR